ncbi:MAG: choice-of-anchor Q domain-containing protein [Roseibacillus sp.]
MKTLLLIAFSTSILHSQVIVSSLADDGAGTLREALASATIAAPTEITFDATLDGGTIDLESQLTVPAGVEIEITANSLGITLDAGGNSRVLKIEEGANASISHLTFTGGNTVFLSPGDEDNGGAIFNENATLSLSHCTISSNSTGGSGGGICNQGSGIDGIASLSLNDCAISENFARVDGGGIYNLSFSNGNSTANLQSCVLSENSFLGDFFHSGGGISNQGSTTGNATFHLRSCTLSDNSADNGGAIRNANASLTLDSCILTSNNALRGGGIYTLDFNDRSSNIVLNDCFLSSNFAESSGGGIYNNGGGSEPGSPASFEVNACVLSDNSSNHGGAIYSGGPLANSSISLDSCTLSGNRANFTGGGIFIDSPNGGNASLNLNSCTLSKNHSESRAGGIYINGSDDGDATINLDSCTLSKNSSTFGGGIYILGSNGGVTLNLDACTIAENSATSTGGGISSLSNGGLALVTLNHSILAENTGLGWVDLSQLGSGSAASITGNSILSSLSGQDSITTGTPGLILANPNLSPLGDYGGSTQTMIPLPGSPAIDVADNTPNNATDQRGFARSLDGDNDGTSTPDIGATEAPNWNNPSDVDYPSIWLTDLDNDGSPFGIEFTLGTDPAVADPDHFRNLQFEFANNDHPTLEFGYNFEAAGEAISIIERSTNLEVWVEIFRSANPDDGPDFIAPGVDTFINAGTSIVIFDNNISPSPATPKIFYRFQADLVGIPLE